MVSLTQPEEGTAGEERTIDLEDPSDRPDEDAEKSELARRLEALVEELPPDSRAAILLRHQQELPYEEIARVLQVPLGTVKARIHRARIMLKQMVAEDPRREMERLRAAAATMQSALDDMLASSDLADGGEHRDILESYRMFAEDRGWLGRIAEIINSGLTAEAAVQKVKDDMRARLEWKEIDRETPVDHELAFWLRRLD